MVDGVAGTAGAVVVIVVVVVAAVSVVVVVDSCAQRVHLVALMKRHVLMLLALVLVLLLVLVLVLMLLLPLNPSRLVAVSVGRVVLKPSRWLLLAVRVWLGLGGWEEQSPIAIELRGGSQWYSALVCQMSTDIAVVAVVIAVMVVVVVAAPVLVGSAAGKAVAVVVAVVVVVLQGADAGALGGRRCVVVVLVVVALAALLLPAPPGWVIKALILKTYIDVLMKGRFWQVIRFRCRVVGAEGVRCSTSRLPQRGHRRPQRRAPEWGLLLLLLLARLAPGGVV
mmetsp:Transcript_52163/g.113590  ORF Transcript_52163/g.113590 Transcript_52163/m.113590 type:complete len:281 (+) Transcript_52163:809-1651(+)